MRIYTYNCEFPLVELHPKMCISAVRIYTNFGVLPHAEIHSLCEFPQEEKCISADAVGTVLSELPHVEIHKSMCKSAPAEIRFSPCGNSHEIVHFRKWQKLWISQRAEILIFGVFPQAEIRAEKWISACQFASGFVNFRWEKRAGIHVFFRGFPHAEIHAEMWILACGNTRGKV